MDRTPSAERRALGRRRTRTLSAGLATLGVAGTLAVAGYTASTAASTASSAGGTTAGTSSTTTGTTTSSTTSDASTVSSGSGVAAATSGGS